MPTCRNVLSLIVAVCAAAILAGCTCAPRPCCPRGNPPVRAAAPKAPVRPDPAARRFHGPDGTPTTFDAVVAGARGADLVAFGELHRHPVGAELELAFLKGLHGGERPVALAMEFLERDTQAAVDLYLAGEIDRDTFRKRARQGRAFDSTHGPLLDFCKAQGIPVIAANAPRPLVTAYRKGELDYAAYLASLTDEERAALPRSTSTPDDKYAERFMALMGPQRGPAFFKSQALWDDAMGEAMADYRDAHPDHVVFFVVGVFHVTEGLGTVTKYLARRPDDTPYVIAMSRDTQGPLDWDPADENAGDTIIRVVPQPTPKRRKTPAP